MLRRSFLQGIIAAAACGGCSLSPTDKFNLGIGPPCRIRIFAADGAVIAEYTSQGSPSRCGDGIGFTDRATGHPMMLTGTIIVDQALDH